MPYEHTYCSKELFPQHTEIITSLSGSLICALYIAFFNTYPSRTGINCVSVHPFCCLLQETATSLYHIVHVILFANLLETISTWPLGLHIIAALVTSKKDKSFHTQNFINKKLTSKS